MICKQLLETKKRNLNVGKYCQNFRGGSWCRKVEAEINLAVFSISSCPKVNFLLARIKDN